MLASFVRTVCRRCSTSARRRRPRPQLQRDNPKLAEFWRAERELEANLRLDQLSVSDVEIHRRHSEAVANMDLMYDDPETGLKVLTRLQHYVKGKCCGSACRHCVYGHEKVKPEVRARRRFNSAFWEDIGQ